MKWIDVSVFRFCISADVDRSAADSANLAVCKRKPVRVSFCHPDSRTTLSHDKRLLSLLTFTFSVGKSTMSMCNSRFYLRFGIKTS